MEQKAETTTTTTNQNENIKSRISNLKTSEKDTQSYRLITLKNNLTVLFIQDKETQKSAASMVVHAGSLKDYPEFQGIAHFLEHMLFMGSEKYQDQAEYQKFIGANGGWTNAYTSLLITNYHFECSKDSFVKALDIFAQFYISPLLKEECVDKEVNAVHSEAQMNLKNDFWRRFQLKKSLSKKGSKYGLFSIGNLETLNKDGLMVALRKFHEQYYSANQMALVVYAPDDLDELEGKIADIFSPIPDTGGSYNNFKHEQFPYNEENSKKLIKMVPVRESDELIVTYTFKSYYEHKKSKVLKYYNHLFGHESKGSILNFLIQEGLATALTSQFEHTEDYFSDVHITVTLTKKGLENWKDVVTVIGAYAKMLKEKGPQKWIFDEEKAVAEMGFLYPEKANGARTCISYAKELVQAAENGDNLEDFLYDMKAWGEYKEDVIAEIAQLFTLENAHIFISSKEFEGKTTEEEYFFKTQYSIEDIPEDVVQSYNNPDLSWATSTAKIDFPPKNTLIPTDFDQFPCEESKMEKISESENSQIWHQQDNIFNLPKVRVSCNIYTEIDDLYTNIKTCMMKDLWVEIFDDSKRSMDYLAEMAKCNFSVSSLYKANKISGGCYTKSLQPFMKMLLDELRLYKDFNDEEKFNNIRQKYINNFKNKQRDYPFRKCFAMATQILTKGKFTYDEIIEALENILFEDFLEFKKKMYQKSRFEWLFEGNITKELSLQIAQEFEQGFTELYNPQVLSKNGLNRLRSIDLPPKQIYFLELQSEVPDDNNGVFMQLNQIGQGFAEFYAPTRFFTSWLKDEFFEELRTNQQLGYAVFAISRKFNGVEYFLFMIQSNVQDTNHLRVQTNKFIEEWITKLKELPEEKIEEIKKGCIASITEKDNNLKEKFDNDWTEIEEHEYMFDRKRKRAELVEKLTKEDLVQFYERVFLGEERRVLEVHQYCPSKREEGEAKREERRESGEIVYVGSPNELKEALGEFEDLSAVIP